MWYIGFNVSEPSKTILYITKGSVNNVSRSSELSIEQLLVVCHIGRVLVRNHEPRLERESAVCQQMKAGAVQQSTVIDRVEFLVQGGPFEDVSVVGNNAQGTNTEL